MGTAPSVFGNVISVSADSITDQVSGITSYVARVEVSQESMDALADLTLVPGMPADVFIATGSRTLMQYIFKPLSTSIAKSLRED
jgi:multidrug efflux pump subunit AcrA (membrane-fusion protein)